MKKDLIRIFAAMLALIFSMSLLVACGTSTPPTDPTTEPTQEPTQEPTEPQKEYLNAKKFYDYTIVYSKQLDRSGHKFLLDSIREYSGNDEEQHSTTSVRMVFDKMLIYGVAGKMNCRSAEELSSELLEGQFMIAHREEVNPNDIEDVVDCIYILGGSESMAIKAVEYFLTHYVINDEAFAENMTYISANRPQLSDPSILLDGDTYYMYGSYDNSGYWYYTSEDLENWSEAKCALAASDFGADYCMNPEIYNYNGKYYIVATYGKNGVRHIGAFVADSAQGPFTVVAEDLANPEWNCIDPTLYFAPDGAVWLAYVAEQGTADADNACMMLTVLKSDFTGVESEARPIFKGSDPTWSCGAWMEGPCFYTTSQGTVLLLFTGYSNFRDRYKCIGSARLMGSEITDEWYIDNPTVYARDWQRLSGNVTTMYSGGHCCIFTDKNGAVKIAYHIESEDADYGFIEIYDIEEDVYDDLPLISHDPLIIRYADPEEEEN